MPTLVAFREHTWASSNWLARRFTYGLLFGTGSAVVLGSTWRRDLLLGIGYSASPASGGFVLVASAISSLLVPYSKRSELGYIFCWCLHLLFYPKLMQTLYCWQTDCANQFAPSTPPPSHLNHYPTIRAVSSSVTTQTLSYSREGVRVTKRGSVRGNDSLLKKTQRLPELSDSDTGVPGCGLPLEIPMKSPEPLSESL